VAGAEDFLNFSIENHSTSPNVGKLRVSFSNGNSSYVALESTSELISEGQWVQVAFKWTWNSGSRTTTFELVKNGISIGSQESPVDAYVVYTGNE
jgi:hypothetical protein